ncbi:MAG TPA: magnesium chelatase domain-containing protein, partial [Acidobacteriota bacterium]|nr:magnesium chelatase domain-containing protein [Acidobacteriota bacterium]
DPNRVALLLAMLEKRAGMHLLGTDVYVNVAGGISISEPALDLALVGAVVSSFNDKALPPDTVVFGEVGLAGEVRAVNLAQTRVKEASNLGFRRVLLPAGNLPLAEPTQNLALQGVSSINDFLQSIDFW